jgi:hypothetical protein
MGPADGALQDDPGHAEAAAVPMVARIFMVTNRAQLTALVTRAPAESTRVAAEPRVSPARPRSRRRVHDHGLRS